MKDLFRGKKVCLLGCGSSLDEKTINYQNYDLICGTNRIYKTTYFKHIDVLFDGSHYIFDPFNDFKIDFLNQSEKLKFIVFSCGFRSYDAIKTNSSKLRKKYFLKYREGALENAPKKKSIGTEAFLTIMGCSPSLLEVFGIDFHRSPYIDQLSRESTHQNPFELHDYDCEEMLCRAEAERFNSLHPNSVVFH